MLIFSTFFVSMSSMPSIRRTARGPQSNDSAVFVLVESAGKVYKQCTNCQENVLLKSKKIRQYITEVTQKSLHPLWPRQRANCERDRHVLTDFR